MDHRPVQGIEYYSGWEKTLDKKLSKVKRQRWHAKLFCHMVKKGTPERWVPCRFPRTQAEVVKRLYG